MKALSEDFYKPRNLGDLHSILFPGRYFDPKSSKDCIYQAFLRLRKYLKTKKAPFHIVESVGQYKLEALPGTQKSILILIDFEKQLPALIALSLNTLKLKFKGEGFSLTQACEAMKKSPNSTREKLKYLEKLGLLTREGQARSTRYFLTRPEAKRIKVDV